MSQTTLIFVGGFLGAGKTTLLTNAAARLAGQGKVVGVITNDQAANLVDTGSLRDAGFAVQEVAGGCFCCRFDQLLDECGRLVKEVKPDIILTEPVGSCTDVSATVLNPMKDLHAEEFRVAPFSVLVDPDRLREALHAEAAGNFPDSVYYIFRKQLEEADLIVLNKADRLSSVEVAALRAAVAKEYPGTPVMAISALEGTGVGAWLDTVLTERPAGRRIAVVDYDVYAEGEAVLGWLNGMVSLRADAGADWPRFCADLLASIQAECRSRDAEIAHAKVLLTTAGGQVAANVTANTGQPSVRGALTGPSQSAVLTVNARVRTSPEELRALVERAISETAGADIQANITSMANFSPSRPNPTHRYAVAV